MKKTEKQIKYLEYISNIDQEIKNILLNNFDKEKLIQVEFGADLLGGYEIGGVSIQLANDCHQYNWAAVILNSLFNVSLSVGGWDVSPIYEYYQDDKSPFNDDYNFFKLRILIKAGMLGMNHIQACRKLFNEITLKDGTLLSSHVRLNRGGFFEQKQKTKKAIVIAYLFNYLKRTYESSKSENDEANKLESRNFAYGYYYRRNDSHSLNLSLEDLFFELGAITKIKAIKNVFIDYLKEVDLYTNFIESNTKNDIFNLILMNVHNDIIDESLKRVQKELMADYLQEKLTEKNSNCMTKLNKKGGKI